MRRFFYMLCMIIVLCMVCGCSLEKKYYTQNETIVIKNSLNNYRISIDNYETNITQTDAIWNQTKKVSRLMVSIQNNAKDKQYSEVYLSYMLLDAKDKRIGICTNLFTQYEEALDPLNKEPSEYKNGYVYCDTNSPKVKKVKITVITGIDEEAKKEGKFIGTGARSYYVKLDS